MQSRIIRLYRAEIELFWKWRLGRWALIKRASIALLAGVLAISLTAWLAPGLFTIEQVGGGLLAVVFISALNLLIRPILVGLLARHTLVGLVIVTILFQALAIRLRPSPSSSILTNGRWTSPLLGVPMVYQQLRRWMEGELGMEFGATKRDPETGTSGDGAAE